MRRGLLPAALVLFGLPLEGHAATCSCAGAPVLIYLDTSATEKGQLFLSYTAEDHQINDLVSGSDDVQDETGRDRSSFSHVLSGSYALTDRWSFSALTSYVEHKRRSGSSLFGETAVAGLGDSVWLSRAAPLASRPCSRRSARRTPASGSSAWARTRSITCWIRHGTVASSGLSLSCQARST